MCRIVSRKIMIAFKPFIRPGFFAQSFEPQFAAFFNPRRNGYLEQPFVEIPGNIDQFARAAGGLML